ncbi:MAG: nucleoid-associated protein [Bacteroidales bacterium]|nr:nucleoid-associated protein [Bacteroidales bacterium]
MMYFADAELIKLVAHKIGNKHEGGELLIANNTLEPDEDLQELLKTYFFSSFKDPIYYQFTAEDGLEANVVYKLAESIFEQNENLFDASKEIASHLFDQSYHPNIKEGELYIALFSNCVVDDEVVEAIGIFKSENKTPFLKVWSKGSDIELAHDTGININKLDKGCLIFNTEKDLGYKICMIDIAGKSKEAGYWKDDFLQLQMRKDDFYQTQNYIQICKGFVKNVFNEKNGIEKADQIDMLNKSAAYFNGNEDFDIQHFEESVIENDEVIAAFNEYKTRVAEENDLEIKNQFGISPTAVKKSRAQFKSVLKLDKNFHIYIHGDRTRIVKGFDQSTGLHYYQIYYEQEN